LNIPPEKCKSFCTGLRQVEADFDFEKPVLADKDADQTHEFPIVDP
jgi:hypothetical protein